MKLNCKNNCEGWIWLGGVAELKTERSDYAWTHCPYCDSGKLIDKEAELREQFWHDIHDFIVARSNGRVIIDKERNIIHKIFNKYDIKRKP